MRVVTAWLKRGGRALDAAYVYGDQVGVGKAIKASGVPRSEIFLTGKVPSGGGGPGPKAGGGVTMGYNETIDSFNTSLKMLGVDYVDLFLMHWPVAWKRGEEQFPMKDGKPVMENIDIVDVCCSLIS